jgi:hypothetical protein
VARLYTFKIKIYDMNTEDLENKKWFEMGYHDQCMEFPLLDTVWGTDSYDMKFRGPYRQGQISAYADGLANKPDFFGED